MYTTHFLFPEQRWGVFKDGVFQDLFDTFEQAQQYITEMEYDA